MTKSTFHTWTFFKRHSAQLRANGRNWLGLLIIPLKLDLHEMKKNRSYCVTGFLNSEQKEGYGYFGSTMKVAS